VYAGLAGFYFVRDTHDTGKEGTGLAGEPVNLPAGEYEVALAIQDRFFKNNGEFLYPAFPGDPGYADFITCRGVNLNPDQTPPFTVADEKQCANVPGCNDFPESLTCGPTALTEFFGDHMVVNGKIWPKMEVYGRHYRLRLLNGCDSRFLAVQFCIADPSAADPNVCESSDRIPFNVIGGDQGLAPSATLVDTLLMETGSRYDIIFDFTGKSNMRVIMKNIGGDMPFGGEIGGEDMFVFDYTDRIMAFDVLATSNGPVDNFNLTALGEELGVIAAARTPLGQQDYTRKVALFEGADEFGRYVCIHRRECQ
jgi:FtsP/CotA-like multicopper oxidase with cupredoxin domain